MFPDIKIKIFKTKGYALMSCRTWGGALPHSPQAVCFVCTGGCGCPTLTPYRPQCPQACLSCLSWLSLGKTPSVSTRPDQDGKK